jgi:predicted DNA-binding protein
MISKLEKKAPKVNIGARVSAEVYSEILRLKESTGKTDSELVNEAIAGHFGFASSASIPDRMSNMEGQIKQLEQQVKTILGKFNLSID